MSLTKKGILSYVKYPWIFRVTNDLMFYAEYFLENATMTTPMRPKVSVPQPVECEASKIVIQPNKIHVHRNFLHSTHKLSIHGAVYFYFH